MSDSKKYATLTRILDALSAEAPKNNKMYHPKPSDSEGLIHARSRAYLHLFMKVKFGMLNFEQREHQTTDAAYDGGVDAYHIDKETKVIYFFQSKFRATAKNFANSQVSADDLTKIQLKQILNGDRTDELGEAYNAKILAMQREIRKIPDIGRYEYKVIILGNTKTLTRSLLEKLCDGFPVEQFDFQRIYNELVFPVVNGVYFSRPDLTINISLTNVRGGKDHLNYSVKAEGQTADVMLLFVPTQEIGRILYTYKNSILRFNPRSYLELKDNPVNTEIYASIVNTTNNEFALFNNGITLLSDKTNINTEVGQQGVGQLAVTNPQIINGGQTAFTLSRVYEEYLSSKNKKLFTGKEVLLRVITFEQGTKLTKSKSLSKETLISDISKASNSQTKVEEADRRSNEQIQLELQRCFFDQFGMFYERKHGEFADGLREGYIHKELVVDRANLMRVALAIDAKASLAKTSIKKFFSEEGFQNSPLKIENVARYAYGYEILQHLETSRRAPENRAGKGVSKFGNALKYGHYAVVAAADRVCFPVNLSAEDATENILKQWKAFEVWAIARSENARYFSNQGGQFISYYKGSTLNTDLAEFPFSSGRNSRKRIARKKRGKV
jgi:hypothetical protein